jgi:hypothetical protein
MDEFKDGGRWVNELARTRSLETGYETRRGFHFDLIQFWESIEYRIGDAMMILINPQSHICTT